MVRFCKIIFCSGYMSPEYAYCGHVSTKSDMFSFGVIVLEMVTGRKSNSTYDYLGTTSLLSYVRAELRSWLWTKSVKFNVCLSALHGPGNSW